MYLNEIKSKQTADNQVQPKREPFFSKDGKENHVNKSNSCTNSFFSPPTIQPKLTIGKPNDKYEVEADTMADKVVNQLSTSTPSQQINGHTVQTKCKACEEKEKLQKKEDPLAEGISEIQRKPIFESNADDDGSNVQTKPNVQFKCTACEEKEKLQRKVDEPSEKEDKIQEKSKGGGAVAGSGLQSKLDATKGGGSPLSPEIQNEMGTAFGADFSKVRVHNDSAAVQMNQELNAQAFTHGNNIYFNDGKYNTESNSGKHLLAHELTHTIQQGNNNKTIRRKNGIAFNENPKSDTATDFDFKASIIGYNIPALVKWDKSPKLRLRSEPDTTNPNNILEHLSFNDKLTILFPAHGGWYKVKSQKNHEGYVAQAYIAKDLPDPESKLHRVDEGLKGYAFSIASKYYSHLTIGKIDVRHYINVLAQINLGRTLEDSWKTVNFKAGNFIWIPGAHYAQKLIASHKKIDLAAAIIDDHTAWHGGLSESGLGGYLFEMAKTSSNYFTTIHNVIEKLDSGDRDEVSYHFVKHARKKIDKNSDVTYTYLDRFLAQGGNFLLNRMYSAMSTDWISDDDEVGSLAILDAKMRAMPVDKLLKQIEKPLIFPLKQMGITVMDDAPISAKKRDGKIVVEYPTRVCNSSKYRKDLDTIWHLGHPCLGQIELDPDQIVGIKIYDQGKVVRYIPASGLILYSNLTSTSTIVKIGEVSTLAIGGFASFAAKGAGWFARAVIWADRIAESIGIIATIINEHRDWILETFPKHGASFLNIVNKVNLVASLYGIGRLVTGVGFASVKAARNKWKSCKTEAPGSLGNKAGQQLDDATRELLEAANKGKLDALEAGAARPYRNMPDKEVERLIKAGDKKAIGEWVYRELAKKFKSEADFLKHTSNLESPKLNIDEARFELELAKLKGVKRPLKNDPLYSEEILFNKHTWKKRKGSKQWCRHSSEVLCYIFGDNDGISIKSFGRRGETVDPANLLRGNMGDPPTANPGWEAHHIIPYELRNHAVIDFIRRQFRSQWNINDASNGVFLPRTRDVPGAGNRSLHRGNHSFYSGVIETQLDYLHYLWKSDKLSDAQLFQRVKAIQDRYRGLLVDGKLPLARER